MVVKKNDLKIIKNPKTRTEKLDANQENKAKIHKNGGKRMSSHEDIKCMKASESLCCIPMWGRKF